VVDSSEAAVGGGTIEYDPGWVEGQGASSTVIVLGLFSFEGERGGGEEESRGGNGCPGATEGGDDRVHCRAQEQDDIRLAVVGQEGSTGAGLDSLCISSTKAWVARSSKTREGLGGIPSGSV
jgi:hypothetical protein